MSALIRDGQLLKTYNGIWDIFTNIMEKAFNSQLVCKENDLGTKIKSYGGKINKCFLDTKISEGSCHCLCVSVLVIDSVC